MHDGAQDPASGHVEKHLEGTFFSCCYIERRLWVGGRHWRKEAIRQVGDVKEARGHPSIAGWALGWDRDVQPGLLPTLRALGALCPNLPWDPPALHLREVSACLSVVEVLLGAHAVSVLGSQPPHPCPTRFLTSLLSSSVSSVSFLKRTILLSTFSPRLVMLSPDLKSAPFDHSDPMTNVSGPLGPLHPSNKANPPTPDLSQSTSQGDVCPPLACLSPSREQAPGWTCKMSEQ